MVQPYTLAPPTGPNLGLIVLQADETLEGDMRRLLPPGTHSYVSRVPCGTEVSRDSLREMEGHLTTAASLFPRGMTFASVGYGCTSGTAQIGASRVANLISAGTTTSAVTEPISALLAACQHLDISRLGLLSPYVASVSDDLRRILANHHVATPAFDSFNEPTEANVVRIDAPSLITAAHAIAQNTPLDALFLSCTNLRTLDVIPTLETELRIPVLSSNLVLAWHMAHLAGLPPLPYRCRLTD